MVRCGFGVYGIVAPTERRSTTSLFVVKRFTCYPIHISGAQPQSEQVTRALCVRVGLLMRLLVASRVVMIGFNLSDDRLRLKGVPESILS